MRLSRYIQTTRALGDGGPAPRDVDAVDEALQAGDDLAVLLGKRAEAFPKFTPRQLWLVWRAAKAQGAHIAHLEAVAARRRAAKQPPIPNALLRQTVAAHEVAILERADELAPPGRAAEHRRRDAIKEAVAVWNACLAVARRDGVIHVKVVGRTKAAKEAWADYAGGTPLSDLPAHRWLALRRGTNEGAIKLTLELPEEAFVQQFAARRTELSAVAGGREPAALYEALVKPDLEDVVLGLTDDDAEQAAIRTAAESYLGLLTATPVRAEHVAGVWVGKKGGQLAVAIVGPDGQVVHHGKAYPKDSPVAAVEGVVGAHVIEAVALPVSADDLDTLNALAAGFENFAVERIPASAMKASTATVEGKMPPACKQAAVLALRALRPAESWGGIDPVGLGLAEYQQDLDEARLRDAMNEMQALASAGVRPEDLARPDGKGARKAAARAPAAPLNPLVKSVDDLRPGMKVNGVVTNVAQFGAFVNIGLPLEGLVHISELAEHYVKDPTEVVKVGLHVSARVLSVDRGRGRIALSLRPDRAAPGPRDREVGERPRSRAPLDTSPRAIRSGGSPRPGGGGPGGGGGGDRARALADLEKLFKKD
jgi:predicted RNA-binding protein with RPS1 domain